MASNQDKVVNHYSNIEEDNRAKGSRSSGLEFHYTKKFISEYIAPESKVLELGCATGYYGMFFSDKCAEYTGIDLSPDNIAVFNEKITAEKKVNVRARVGDATNIHEIADNSFDVILCLGPMYHLPREERLKVFDECRRVARPGGILAFAYINGIGAYVGACVHDELRGKYPNADTNHSVFELSTDDVLPGLFFFTSPEEMENDAKQKNLEVLKSRGVNFDFASCAVNAMSDEQFEHYMTVVDKMSESSHCAGLSAHTLLFCRKGN